mgnify:CR=1 FL=1
MIDDELQDWIDKSLNETASDDEVRALEGRLLEDTQAREHYLKEVSLHASLRRRFASEPVKPSTFIARLPVLNRRKLGFGLAIAAGIALIASAIALLLPENLSFQGA